MAEHFFHLSKIQSRLALLAAGTVALAAAALAQTAPQAPPAQAFAYEVASVKPHKAGDGSMWWRTAPDGFSASGVSLENLIMDAYGLVMPDQLSGLPEWAKSDSFDIEAKMDEDTAAALKKLPGVEYRRQYGLMMQSLLADRFQLKVHHETRDLPVYNLVIAKDGLKMKQAPAHGSAGYSMSNGRLEGNAVPMDSLVFSLANDVGRFVINKTGLTGNYAITLKWTPFDQSAQAETGPDIFAALEEQLGLKLVSAKGPVDTIVVDRVEKPSPN